MRDRVKTDGKKVIWVIGDSDRVGGFRKNIVSGFAGDVVYTENLRQALAWEFFQPGNGLHPVIFVFPSAGEVGLLPDFFSRLAEWGRYEVYIDDTLLTAFVLPETMSRKIAGHSFRRFSFREMSGWQRTGKRIFDMVFCLSGLAVLSPLLLVSMLMVKVGSPGPVFYSQERIGKKGRAFRIYKFRSMRVGAETGTPCLSSQGDPRITPWGRIMRKYRIDELPQLWNVLKGDMSVVGYRPERQYFISQIEREAPYYPLLYAVKPGITSLGITTFGYAENVPQMIVRLACDMEYIDRLSLKEDVRILGRTCKVVFYGVGK